jgi:hypothetical protein
MKGQEVLRELRAQGIDPTQTPAAKAKHAASQARRRAEQKAWDAAHPDRPDPEVFRQEIWPRLKGMSIHALCQATGLSTAQCWRIRRGDLVPHSRWWETLRGFGAAIPPFPQESRSPLS